MKRTALARRTPLRTSRRTTRARWPVPVGNARCEACCARAVHRHHLIDAQVCKRHGASVTDLRNSALLCARCHMDHHAFTRRLARPADDHPVHAFAAEHNLGWWLDRFYPKET
jgi:hypothetical protein